MPDWDFVDPGMPLMYVVSAVAWLIGGRALGTELAVVAGALAIGGALMVAAGARLSSSAAIATLVAVLGVLIHPRSYGYPKVLLYAAMAAILARPAVNVSVRRIVALAFLTARGFLFRHDHGLFLGLGSAASLGAPSRVWLGCEGPTPGSLRRDARAGPGSLGHLHFFRLRALALLCIGERLFTHGGARHRPA